MFKRLDIKILVTLSLILAVMISVFGWRVGKRQGEIYVQAMTENLRVLARTHARNAAHFMVVNDFAGLEEHMLEAAMLPDIVAIQVIEPDGAMLCNVERPSIGEPAKVLYLKQKGIVPKDAEESMQQAEDRLFSWTPIVAGKPLGWLKIVYTLHSVRDMHGSIWKNSLLMGVLWVLVGTVLMIMLLKRPLGAIRELASFAHDLNRRKGAQFILPPVSHEIDQLATALNYASSELMSAEQQLVAEKERLVVTIRSIADGVLACDREGRVVLMNRVAEELTGWTMAEAAGTVFTDVLTLVDEQTGEPLNTRLNGIVNEGQVIEFAGSAVLLSRDGTHRNNAVSGAPIIDSRGEIIGIVIVFKDETERLRATKEKAFLEEQLRHSQKLEAVGQLAGGIAHDFNNILTAIIGYSEILRGIVDKDPQALEFTERILHASERAAGLTRSLLAFSRKQKMEVKPFDLNAEILNIEKILRRIIGEDVELRILLESGPIIVSGDAGQIDQVLINLATNARDAMPSGGLLTIHSSRALRSSTEGAEPVQMALITVSDTGNGIDPELRDKIFDPFFTTKEVGKGTGLGLSIVDGIVRQHQGSIQLYSEAGIGTSFKIFLPIQETGEELPAVELCAPSGGTETVLLVEDEDDVRLIARNILEKAGYKVFEASNGVQALHRIASITDRINLLLTDVIMPKMNGKELSDKVRRELPGIRVLYMSGYTWDVIQYKGILAQGDELIIKPFDTNLLLRKVRESIDRG